MNQLWNIVLHPIIRAINPDYIVEIGSINGIMTKNILDYCKTNNTHLTKVDNSHAFDTDNFKEKYEDKFEIFTKQSVNRLALLEGHDLVIIYGDSNSYKSYHELKIIEKSFKNKKFPIVFLLCANSHQVKRNIYTDSENELNIKEQINKQLGDYSTQKKLLNENRFNSGFYDPVHDNQQSDFITALENFVKESDREFTFKIINKDFGLAILFLKDNEIENIAESVIKSYYLNYPDGKGIKLSLKDYNESERQNNTIQGDLDNNIIKLNHLTEKLNLVEDQLRLTKNQLKISNEQIIEMKLNKKQDKLRVNQLTNRFIEIEYHNNKGRSIKQRLISKFPSLYILSNDIRSIRNALINIKGYKAIKDNNLLDIGYYLEKNPDIRLSGADPILHYIFHGFKEGRNPNPLFDTDYYLDKYDDVRSSNLNPLIHYSLYGMLEGRKTRTKTKIAIKIAAPNWKRVNEWGDYHFALGLKKEFQRKNWGVIIQTVPEWYNNEDSDCDVVIVLRGLQKYSPKTHHVNIMWNISHPDEIDIDEYNQYEHVLVASKVWAEKLKGNVSVPVESMLQCTDPELFYPDPSKDYEHDLLFVGNSRKIFRKIIKDLLPTNKSLSVYGTNWEELIDEKYIVADHIPNKELRKAYSSCKILLNDHWDDMREKGFISNRIFDGYALGAFIISDEVKGADEVFGNAIITYKTHDELNNLINYYLDNKELRRKKSEKIKNFVINHHTFKNRVEQIIKIIDSNL